MGRVCGGWTYTTYTHSTSLLSLLPLGSAPSYRRPLVCPLTKVVNIAKIAKMTKVANPVRSNHCEMGKSPRPTHYI